MLSPKARLLDDGGDEKIHHNFPLAVRRLKSYRVALVCLAMLGFVGLMLVHTPRIAMSGHAAAPPPIEQPLDYSQSASAAPHATGSAEHTAGSPLRRVSDALASLSLPWRGAGSRGVSSLSPRQQRDAQEIREAQREGALLRELLRPLLTLSPKETVLVELRGGGWGARAMALPARSRLVVDDNLSDSDDGGSGSGAGGMLGLFSRAGAPPSAAGLRFVVGEAARSPQRVLTATSLDERGDVALVSNINMETCPTCLLRALSPLLKPGALVVLTASSKPRASPSSVHPTPASLSPASSPADAAALAPEVILAPPDGKPVRGVAGSNRRGGKAAPALHTGRGTEQGMAQARPADSWGSARVEEASAAVLDADTLRAVLERVGLAPLGIVAASLPLDPPTSPLASSPASPADLARARFNALFDSMAGAASVGTAGEGAAAAAADAALLASAMEAARLDPARARRLVVAVGQVT